MPRIVAALGRASYFADRALERGSGGKARLHAMWFYSQPVPPARAPASEAPGTTGRAGTPRATGSIVVRGLRAGEIDEAAFQRPPGIVAARFRAGSECIGALRGDELLGYAWIESAAVDELLVRAVFEPSPRGRVAWDYDVWIAPKHRLGRVFARLWEATHDMLRERGVEATVSWIAMRNEASIRAHERMGARRVGWAVFLAIGRLQLTLASVRPFVHVGWPGRPPVRLRVRGVRGGR